MKRKTNTIAFADLNDSDEIMKFIDLEWKKNHILAINKQFFLSEYKNANKLNFVISRSSDNRINAILGFLKSRDDDYASVWTTMWKVSSDAHSIMLGVELLRYLQSYGFKNLMSNGINSKTEEIYNYLGFHTGALSHFYIANRHLRHYKIAQFMAELPEIIVRNSVASFLECRIISMSELGSKFNFDKYRSCIPCKDFEYFKRRFFEHPIYDYQIYGVCTKSKILSIMVTRIVSCAEAKCIRIVDFYGEELVFATFIKHLEEMMWETKSEYIDFYCAGLNEELVEAAGFSKVNESVIIPNYFEPLVKRNSTISYFIDSKNIDNFRMYKADGDQDRPSMIDNLTR